MLKRPFKSVIARIAIVALALSLVFPFIPAALADGHIERSYAENGTDPIQRFYADDVEGDTITWSVEGDDSGDFQISDAGVLSFKESPNFEKPADDDEDNVYKVTVVAAGKSKAEQKVEVTVTDVAEDGKVAFNGLGRYQPQVGRGLSVDVTDPDNDGPTDVKWQWARGANADGPWTDIDKATNSERTPTADDVDHFLRATATYTDKHGPGQTASAISDNAVEARTVANAAPDLSDHDTGTATGNQVSRDVNENAKNANVGKPVNATDGDDDVLHYTIADGTTGDTNNNIDELTLFSIDERSGQITTIKEDIDADRDSPDGTEEDTYTVIVTATDPSGAKDTATVTITIKNINDAPAFNDANVQKKLWVTETTETQTGKALRITEASPGTSLNPNAYVVTDDDTADAGELSYSLEGADKDKFHISNSGVLNVCTVELCGTGKNHNPDYETQSSYSITVVGSDDDDATAKVDVTVTVTNANDAGSVKFSQRTPQIDTPVVATLTDPDGSISGLTWQWSSATPGTDVECPDVAADDFADIDDAEAASYTPVEADDGKCLRATATYKDSANTSANTSANGITDADTQESDPANTAPKFADDQDLNTAGDQADAERSVAENDKDANVGDAVTASDADATENGDLLMYTIGGADASSFTIERDKGQIKAKGELNYESKSSYTVVVTATDPSGATDTVNVNITVTDEDDKGVITGKKAVDYAENGAAAVASYSATDEDGDAIVWSLDGADKADFEISDTGVLSFKDSPDFEKPADGTNGTADNIYKVTVIANKGEHKVEVTVTDVDEAGKVTLNQPQPQAGRPIEASDVDDPDGPVSDSKWQWARSADMETWTDIAKANSATRTPTNDDVGSYLRATVTYTDRHGEDKTASAVSENAVEPRTVANAAPKFPDDAGTREVNENAKDANVGKPVAASDADGDVLLYKLEDAQTSGSHTDDDQDPATAAASDAKNAWKIDPRTGQITTVKALDSNPTELDTDANETSHTVKVTATDPSGAPKEQLVVITIKNVNDAPQFAKFSEPSGANQELNNPPALTVLENTLDLDGQPATADNQAPQYQATDDDSDATLTYAVTGTDAKYFEIASSGDQRTLTFKTDTKVNYEEKKSYSITVTATDGKKAVGKVDVKVTVNNNEDPGAVSLSARQPQENLPVSASFKDEDGGTKNVVWQWYWDDGRTAVGTSFSDVGACSTNAGSPSSNLCRIANASSPSYTPESTGPAGITTGWFLTARVTYNDAYVTDLASPAGDDGDSAYLSTEVAVQASDPANAAPKFLDQDPGTPGDQSDTATRSVKENEDKGATIGDAIEAQDGNSDKLVYTLGGPDADSFEVVSGLGYTNATIPEADLAKITTAEKFDYETKNVYTVVLTATDPSGASDSITITVNVTDVDDKPAISTNKAPEFAAETAERSVDENSEAGTSVGDPVTATDDDALTYALSGDDAAHFDIDDMGRITVAEGAMLDYEAEQNTYMVTVTATDTRDTSDSIAVTITVNDVDENNAPAFDSETYTRTVPENSAGGANVGDPVTATDADEDDTLAYSLADESGSFQIDSETGQVTVAEGASLDYETQTSYTVTVTATDGEEASASAEVTINVGNVGLANPYDTDDSGSISKVEAVNAVKDYFDDELSREDVLAVIRLYFG